MSTVLLFMITGVHIKNDGDVRFLADLLTTITIGLNISHRY